VKNCDIESISMKDIRRQLNQILNCSVDDRKDFIRGVIEEFFLSKQEQEEEVEDANTEEEEEKAEIETSIEVIRPAKRRGSGFTQPLVLASDLSEFMGQKNAARTDVTKKIWDYIKANNLQNPLNRREILCDATLEKVLKKKKVTMFKMTKVLAPVSFLIRRE
jgi:chromatin remodeling complex protein RSC6